MDVLRPEIRYVEGRAYCCYHTSWNGGESNTESTCEQLTGNHAENWDDDDDDPSVTCIEGGKYKTRLRLPSAFHKYVIGPKGSTRRSIEADTGTRVQIPACGREGDVVMTGPTRSAVCSARSRVELLVADKRWREPFTHFLSISLVAVREGFLSFKEKVLQDYSTSGSLGGASDRASDMANEALFQRPTKLHLTICTLTLLDDDDLDLARHLLANCKPRVVTWDSPLVINVRGLEYMNDDPQQVDVLYAKVRCEDGSDRLQSLADRLTSEFVDANLSQRQYDSCKPHATLMNTLFRLGGGSNPAAKVGGKKTKRETFDASRILNSELNDFDFGRVMVDCVHLSERGGTGQDGYYRSSAQMSLS